VSIVLVRSPSEIAFIDEFRELAEARAQIGIDRTWIVPRRPSR
jgi:hypothetical protein